MLKQCQCKTCGRSFTGGPRAYYCPNCRLEREKVATKEYKRNKKLGLTRDLGSIDKCEKCESEYVVEAGLQRFCPECQPIHSAEYDRETAIIFYHENKEEINPTRNERRRIGTRKCTWCEKEFETDNKLMTCSDECRRLLKNKKWNVWNHKNKAPLE